MALSCGNKLFSLGEINIIGGDYKECLIYINDLDSGGYMNLENVNISFSLIPYINRNGVSIFSKTNKENPEDLFISSDGKAFLLILRSSDTAELSGRFIYQITVQSADGLKKESFQGVMIINKNIAPNIL